MPSNLMIPNVERAPWAEVVYDFMRVWDQGQHVSCIGPNGGGKSSVCRAIIEERIRLRHSRFCMLHTKRKDRLFERFLREGWHQYARWPPDWEGRESGKVIIRPPYGRASDISARKRVIIATIDAIIKETSWGLYVDEAAYLVETLGLRILLDELWNSARAADITVVAGSQRASWINRAMLSEQQWLIGFKLTDRDDRLRLAEVMGNRELEPVLDSLKPHEFVVGRTRVNEYVISQLPRDWL